LAAHNRNRERCRENAISQQPRQFHPTQTRCGGVPVRASPD
jgi:hypothetical protein